MSTLADSLVSSSARPLTIRMRPDLDVALQRYEGRRYWVVKDPVALAYFRFQEEEYALLRMLDGKTSLEQMKERFEAEFTPQKITLEELQQFLGSLHRSGLVLADVTGQGEQLNKRRGERKRKERLAKLSSILAIRFRGIDPGRLLDTVYPWVRWMFHPAVVALSIMLIFAASALIIIQFDVFRARLPRFEQFFGAHNWFWLAVALGVTKILHEMGHGLVCRHFGGQCHEMGVMLLVLTPCLYMNVSDSWMLPSKWRRAAIAAAGIYVELVIAAIATFIWWFSDPNALIAQVCLSVMFVSSVSTVLFNGNPLLRYDGYYILSDLVEIPNLRQKASSILNRTMGHWFLGIEPPPDPFLPQRKQAFFALYAVAAAIYRWVVVLGIFYFLHKVFEPYRLEVIGQIIGFAALYGLIIQPLWKLGKFFYVPGRLRKVKRTRFAVSLAGAAAVILAVLLIPLPYHVLATFEVQPADAVTVYVEEPGQLTRGADRPRAGDRVQAGQLLAQLESFELEQELASIERELAEVDLELQYLDARRRFLESAEYFQLQRDLASQQKRLRSRLNEKREQVARLHITAPVEGTVLPAASRSGDDGASGLLPSWSGSPLSRRNDNAFLDADPRHPLCRIGDPERLEANIVIDQSDIEFIREGQSVELMLDQSQGEIIESMIAERGTDKLEYAPTALSNKAGGQLATETDASGREKLLVTAYEATAPLSDADHVMRAGLRGTAKVHAGYRSLGQRLARYISQTFNFKL
ncbi:MAG: hemolysin D [Pirellulales bacterium]|nr:hemolysin D [Pirellulales bacterium]